MDQEYSDSEAQSSDIASVSSNAPEAYIKDMRRVRDSVPWRLWIVAAIAFCERAAFWGLTAPWRKFLYFLVLTEPGCPMHY
jgi:POT family proton-dependent oligopeptide transporter